VRYLVMPRLLAGVIAVPALCMYVNVIGLVGAVVSG
jgi:ABC-type transporter Mla maintaining outer membrane lipid asymmetry permease subunit MlaE